MDKSRFDESYTKPSIRRWTPESHENSPGICYYELTNELVLSLTMVAPRIFEVSPPKAFAKKKNSLKPSEIKLPSIKHQESSKFLSQSMAFNRRKLSRSSASKVLISQQTVKLSSIIIPPISNFAKQRLNQSMKVTKNKYNV